MNCFTVLSISSGGRFADYVPPDVRSKFFTALDTCGSIRLTGFTELQAKKYVEERNKIRLPSLNFSDIEGICGTNPLLISRVYSADSDLVYGVAEREVRDYIKNNLALMKNPENLKQFLMQKDLLACKKFIDYACRGDELNKQDKVNYEKSWLFKYEITLLEIESRTFETVEVLSSETVSSKTESQSVSTSKETTQFVSVLK